MGVYPSLSSLATGTCYGSVQFWEDPVRVVRNQDRDVGGQGCEVFGIQPF